jgi:ATP-binding cassette subfamily B protein
LAQNRTVLVIAHHLRTIRAAAEILVFDKGEVIERSGHQDLLARDGLYAALWEAQEKAKVWKISSPIDTHPEAPAWYREI